jgi:polyferredoxin
MKRVKQLIFVIMTALLSTPALFSQDAAEAAEHATRKTPTILDILVSPRFFTKTLVMLIVGLGAFFLLKTNKMKKGLKVGLLLFSTFMFGFLGNVFSYFAMHPSPICSSTKAFLYGLKGPFIIGLGVIFLLTLIGPKLFCGWVCPVGAVQELISMLADKLKIKRGRFSFRVSNTVRLTLFLAFIFLSITKVLYQTYEGEVYALEIYNYLNAFHGMEFGLQENIGGYLVQYLPFLMTIILSFKYYRPFCHFVCPIGLFTHQLEQIGLFRIRLNRDKCTDCGICEKKAPCAAMSDIMKESSLRPDCFGCNECIAVCPENALDICTKRVKKSTTVAKR